jgi:hypothetical protein
VPEKEIKNLTAEAAEHAEIKMDKGSKPRGQGEEGPISKASGKTKTPNGLPEKDLCVLCFLFGHPFVFIR